MVLADRPLTGQRKAAHSVAVKLEGDSGKFRAVFSSFNVIDLDGDVTMPGAFERGQKTRIAQWGHNWGGIAIGTGTIDHDETKAWVDGQFILSTGIGRDTYETVKALGDLQEWSYGYDILKWSQGEFEGQQVRMFLEALKVHEVSPVMIGAGIDTRTEFVKGLQGVSMPLEYHVAVVTDAMDDLKARMVSLADTRLKEGRELSQSNIDRIGSHADAADSIAKGLRDLLEKVSKPKAGNVARGRVIALQAELEELTAGIL